MSFLNDSYLVILCHGAREDGTPYWAYMKMSPLKAKALQAARASGQPFELESYGELLRHGFDAQVPEQVKAEMEAEYQVVHDLGFAG